MVYKLLWKFKLEELFLLGFYCFCFVLIQQQNICRRSWRSRRSQFQSTTMPMIYLLLSFRERAAVSGSEYLTSQGKSKPLWSLRPPVKHCKPACLPGPPNWKVGELWRYAPAYCYRDWGFFFRPQLAWSWAACWRDPSPLLSSDLLWIIE